MSRQTRYLVYRIDGARLALIDDFGAREAAAYVHMTIPNFLTHIRADGYCEGNGHRVTPYVTRAPAGSR